MTQGVYVRGQHPKTKKELLRAIQDDPASVRLIATSQFGGEHDGAITTMAPGVKAYVVGPSPQNRKWYANILRLARGGFEVH